MEFLGTHVRMIAVTSSRRLYGTIAVRANATQKSSGMSERSVCSVTVRDKILDERFALLCFTF